MLSRRALGATVVSDINDLCAEDLGTVSGVETLKIDGVEHTSMEAVGGVKPLVRGSSPEGLEELKDIAERALLLRMDGYFLKNLPAVHKR